MIKVEPPSEPPDKQSTGELPVVKPPTVNSLMLERMQYLEGTLSDGLQVFQYFAKISEQQEVIKTRLDMGLILLGFILAGVILCLIFLAFFFGR